MEDLQAFVRPVSNFFRPSSSANRHPESRAVLRDRNGPEQLKANFGDAWFSGWRVDTQKVFPSNGREVREQVLADARSSRRAGDSFSTPFITSRRQLSGEHRCHAGCVHEFMEEDESNTGQLKSHLLHLELESADIIHGSIFI